MNNLTKEEIVCLYALMETSSNCYISNNYCFGNYAECCLCLNKENEQWKICFWERGLKFQEEIFDDINKVCLKVIWYCCYDKDAIELAIEYYLMEIQKSYTLSSEELNNFKEKYLTDVCITNKKLVIAK